MIPYAHEIPRGTEIGIPAGTKFVSCTHPSRPTHTKRKQVIKVWFAYDRFDPTVTSMRQLDIVWTGTGGYWKEVLWGPGFEIVSRLDE